MLLPRIIFVVLLIMTHPNIKSLNTFPDWVNKDHITNLLNADNYSRLSRLRYQYTDQISKYLENHRKNHGVDPHVVQSKYSYVAYTDMVNYQNNHFKILLVIPRDLVIKDIMIIANELVERFDNVFYQVGNKKNIKISNFDFFISERPSAFYIET